MMSFQCRSAMLLMIKLFFVSRGNFLLLAMMDLKRSPWGSHVDLLGQFYIWLKSTEYPVVMFFWTKTNKEFPGNRKTLCVHIKVCPNEAVRLKKDT